MCNNYPDFNSMKMMMKEAAKHRALGHKVKISDRGAFCYSCGWNYLPLIISWMDTDVNTD